MAREEKSYIKQRDYRKEHGVPSGWDSCNRRPSLKSGEEIPSLDALCISCPIVDRVEPSLATWKCHGKIPESCELHFVKITHGKGGKLKLHHRLAVA